MNTTNAFNPGSQRVNLLRDPTLPESERTLTRWVDTSAAVPPPLYTFGTSARAVMTEPGLTNLDASVLKNLRWGERYNIQLRLESFNFTNHTQFSSPGASLGSSTVSVIGGARQSRVNQLGMNLEFR